MLININKLSRFASSATLILLFGGSARLAAQTPPQEQTEPAPSAAPAPAASAEPQTSAAIIRKESKLVLVDAVDPNPLCARPLAGGDLYRRRGHAGAAREESAQCPVRATF